MNLFVLGLNHKTAPLYIREKIAFPPGVLTKALISLNKYPYVEENVILSTCNRVEVYVGSNTSGCLESIRQFLYDFHRIKKDLSSYFYIYQNREAVRHLFRVASSLDSMVIGENQILGQVKDAYYKARSCEVVGKRLGPLFEEAIRVGKRVRTTTCLGKGAVSISTIAIELAKKTIGDLLGKKVLIVGAGKIGKLTAKNLSARGINAIYVANRTYWRALQLAKDFGGKALRFDSLTHILKEVDIVITASSAPHFIIKRSDILEATKARRSPLFLIDLGVPRNIEESISQIKNVYLYDIDDLTKVRDQNLANRLKEVGKVERIIEEAVENFLAKENLIECSTKE
jgi:glutamyl-tRNA reductase